jgi:hypothetical protein
MVCASLAFPPSSFAGFAKAVGHHQLPRAWAIKGMEPMCGSARLMPSVCAVHAVMRGL